MDIQDASVKLAEDSVNSAQSKFDAGLIPELDVTRAQLRQARERTSAVLQREAMRNAIDSLLLLLGLEVGGAPELVSAVSYQPEDTDLDAAVEQSLKLRPELRLADLSVEDREAALRINRSEARPTLDLLAGWGEARNGAAERDWNVGLELNVPISSRRLKNSVLQAEWNLLVERQDREDLQQQIVAQVRSQVRAAEAARASVEIDTESVELAKKSLYYAQRMWEEGLLTNRDLLDAQDEVTRSESGLVTSKVNYYLSVVRLHRAIGLNVAEDLPAEPDLPGSQADEEASVG